MYKECAILKTLFFLIIRCNELPNFGNEFNVH